VNQKNNMKASQTLFVIGLFSACTMAAQAQLNYDPSAPDPAPTLDGGWAYDQVQNYVLSYGSTPTAGAASDSSPYVFTLASSANFLITDAFVPGDSYAVYNGNSLLLTTTAGSGGSDNATDGASAWADPEYDHGSIVLGPGTYSLTVESQNETGVLPAGFFTELASSNPTGTVPDGGSLTVITGLLWAGLLGLGARIKRS
jgi:hypothetical protein